MAVSEVQSFDILVESMAVHRQMWCWRQSWEFCIWIARQQEKRVCHWAWFELLKPQSPPPVTHLPQSGHIYSIKATPPNSAFPVSLWGHFLPDHHSGLADLQHWGGVTAVSSREAPAVIIHALFLLLLLSALLGKSVDYMYQWYLKSRRKVIVFLKFLNSLNATKFQLL